MYEEVLRDIGLSPNEALVYETLLHLGEATVQAIAERAKVHRRNVYDSVGKLIDRGLAAEILSENEKRIRAHNPRRILDLLQEKEERVNKFLPDMQKLYDSFEEHEEAYVYRGIQGVKNYLYDILKTNETVYFIGAKGIWMDPRLKHTLAQFQRERTKLGIQFKHIFDYRIKEQNPGILEVVGKPYKFLPKQYSSPTMVDIFGDYVVTFITHTPGSLPAEPIQFVLKSRQLADGYRKFWQFMWDHIAE